MRYEFEIEQDVLFDRTPAIVGVEGMGKQSSWTLWLPDQASRDFDTFAEAAAAMQEWLDEK